MADGHIDISHGRRGTTGPMDEFYFLSPNCDITSYIFEFFPESTLGDGPNHSRITVHESIALRISQKFRIFELGLTFLVLVSDYTRLIVPT